MLRGLALEPTSEGPEIPDDEWLNNPYVDAAARYVSDAMTDPERDNFAKLLEDPSSDASHALQWLASGALDGTKALDQGQIAWDKIPNGEEEAAWEKYLDDLHERNDREQARNRAP